MGWWAGSVRSFVLCLQTRSLEVPCSELDPIATLCT